MFLQVDPWMGFEGIEMGAQPRAAGGLFASVPALERFAKKCRFEPETGCVLWIGGTTSGHGRTNNAVYGSFWYDGGRWAAHRWAAVFIHGLDVGTDTVGHCCPHTSDGHPNTLCVEHLEVQTMWANVTERNTRRAELKRAIQTPEQRLFWKLVGMGHEPPPPVTAGPEPGDIGWFDVPAWLKPFHSGSVNDVGCPF